jgi:hypothetical protein
LWCAVFAVAFAYIESCVVVYLRNLYYPDGFAFPLQEMPLALLLTEAGREAATIVVLLALSRLSEAPWKSRFFLFLYCFGIWDIFYYVWLKIHLNWPSSVLDWDVLFLIPLPWVGPVLSPLIVSLLFVAAAVAVTRLEAIGRPVAFGNFDWIGGLAAAGIIVGSYFWQTGVALRGGIPRRYPWWLWGIGVFVGMALFLTRILDRGRNRPG